MIFRDDDIGYQHTAHAGELQMQQDFLLRRFVGIDQLFIQYGVDHHIAIIMKDFEKATGMIEYIKAHPHIKPNLHCWAHDDYSAMEDNKRFADLRKAVTLFKEIFGNTPDTFYPPFNRINVRVIEQAWMLRMETSNMKMSLSGYLRGHQQQVINFHYWSDECNDLEAALKKYTSK